jgi:acyl-CoA hydrolase
MAHLPIKPSLSMVRTPIKPSQAIVDVHREALRMLVGEQGIVALEGYKRICKVTFTPASL